MSPQVDLLIKAAQKNIGLLESWEQNVIVWKRYSDFHAAVDELKDRFHVVTDFAAPPNKHDTTCPFDCEVDVRITEVDPFAEWEVGHSIQFSDPAFDLPPMLKDKVKFKADYHHRNFINEQRLDKITYTLQLAAVKYQRLMEYDRI